MKKIPVLQLQNLTVEINGRNVIEDVGFELFENEVTAIVGESGSGKTLTALSLLDLLPEAALRKSGKVFLRDRDLFDVPEKKKRFFRGRKIAMVFQEPFSALNPLLRIGVQLKETVIAHDFIARKELSGYIAKLLEMVNLPVHLAESYPHQLSGGMRQRVVLAMALSCDPDVLILDEPTTALDIFTQRTILQMIKDIQREKNFAVLFITHDFSVVKTIADMICVMRRGRIVEKGSRDKVLADPEASYTKHLLECVPRLGDERHRLPTVER